MNDSSKKTEETSSPLWLGLVDELVAVKAAIAELKKKEDKLKADLIEAAERAGTPNTIIEGLLGEPYARVLVSAKKTS